MREPTADERAFFAALSAKVSGVQDWYHVDPDGRPWMMVSLDIVGGTGVRATWRLDYDGHEIAGGLSPACLNWDAETRADAAQVDTTEPTGIRASVRTPSQAAALAIEWFHRRTN